MWTNLQKQDYTFGKNVTYANIVSKWLCVCEWGANWHFPLTEVLLKKQTKLVRYFTYSNIPVLTNETAYLFCLSFTSFCLTLALFPFSVKHLIKCPNKTLLYVKVLRHSSYSSHIISNRHISRIQLTELCCALLMSHPNQSAIHMKEASSLSMFGCWAIILIIEAETDNLFSQLLNQKKEKCARRLNSSLNSKYTKQMYV
jgi:hypothetical protein